jgi:energy-converting hydrogenase Eha subunit E
LSASLTLSSVLNILNVSLAKVDLPLAIFGVYDSIYSDLILIKVGSSISLLLLRSIDEDEGISFSAFTMLISLGLITGEKFSYGLSSTTGDIFCIWTKLTPARDLGLYICFGFYVIKF